MYRNHFVEKEWFFKTTKIVGEGGKVISDAVKADISTFIEEYMDSYKTRYADIDERASLGNYYVFP